MSTPARRQNHSSFPRLLGDLGPGAATANLTAPALAKPKARDTTTDALRTTERSRGGRGVACTAEKAQGQQQPPSQTNHEANNNQAIHIDDAQENEYAQAIRVPAAGAAPKERHSEIESNRCTCTFTWHCHCSVE